MTESKVKQELIEQGQKKAATTEHLKEKTVSDVVIIEIVHAFKDIIIEFINRKYSKNGSNC